MKRVIEAWEPDEFAELVDQMRPIEFEPEVLPEEETLREANDKVKDEVENLISSWTVQPSQVMKSAMYVVAMYVKEDHVWSASNDILATRVIDLLCGESFRAHKDGVYLYGNGDWAFVEEIKYPYIRKILAVLGCAAKVFAFLVSRETKRDVAAVFQEVGQHHEAISASTAACHADFGRPRQEDPTAWSKEGGRVTLDLTQRYSTKGKSTEFIESYGQFFQIPKPTSEGAFVNAQNVTLKISREGSADERFRSVKKSPSNNCYLGVPVSLDYKPSWQHEEEMRLFLCTSFAGNPEGRRMDMAAEALVWYDVPSPQIGLIMTGDGGNAKSAKAALRANVLGEHHHFVSSDVLQVPEEFRKQGKHFARARAATVQENQGGVPWIEDVVKRWLSGEYVACRALFGKSTDLFSWLRCVKYFEWNRTYPSIRGDWRNMHSLRSFWRRLAVIELGAVFTSDPSKVNVDGKVFHEKDLTAFLESPEARLVYIRSYLIPFMQKYNAEKCRQILKNPSAEVVEATQRVAAQMANGGLELPKEWMDARGRQRVAQEAKALLMEVHAWLGDDCLSIKMYDLVKKKDNPIPGTITGKRSGKSRQQHFEDAVNDYPYIFRIDGSNVLKLNVKLNFLETLLDAAGRDSLAGGLEGWGVYWDLRSQLRDFSPGEEQHVNAEVLVASDVARSLTETINIVDLENEVGNKEGNEFDYARRYIARHRENGIRKSDFSSLTVTYYRKYDMQGREYAHSPSAQGLKTALKKHAFRSQCDIDASYGDVFENYDIDCVNAFMQFLWNELYDVVGSGTEIEYETFTAYVRNPRGFRSLLASYLDITVKEAKKQLISILHCGEPKDELPLLWSLAVELRTATRVILEKPRFHHLNSKFADRRFPMATRLHYALSAIEDELIMNVHQALTREFGEGVQVLVYMFDGLIVRFDSLGNDDKLRDVLTKVGEKANVSFTCEKF